MDRVYGVFLHDSGNGYICRTGERVRGLGGRRATIDWPVPYKDEKPVAIFPSRETALLKVERLNDLNLYQTKQVVTSA